MKTGTIFVAVLITLDMAACVTYAVQRDYARAWYWLAAANITASTLLIK